MAQTGNRGKFLNGARSRHGSTTGLRFFRKMRQDKGHCAGAEHLDHLRMLRIQAAYSVDNRWIVFLRMIRKLLYCFRRNLFGLLRRDLRSAAKQRRK